MLLGKWKSQPLWLVAENDQDEREYLSLRSLLSLPTEDFHVLSRGVEINHFLETHQFCGKCGQKAEQTHDELAVQCTSCGYRTYPVICPSIIVAVRRGTEILLANHKRHYTPSKAGMYTTLAGFVEVGETFEMRFAAKSLKKPVFALKIFAISVANLGHSLIHKWWAF